MPIRDRWLVLYDLLEQIAELEAEDGDPAEIEQLVAEYRRNELRRFGPIPTMRYAADLDAVELQCDVVDHEPHLVAVHREVDATDLVRLDSVTDLDVRGLVVAVAIELEFA